MPHLQQAGLVSVVFLRLSSLHVHLVSLTGPNQLLVVVEQRWIQGMGIDQTHQVLPVVPPEGTQMLWCKWGEGKTSRPSPQDSLAESSLAWLSLDATRRIDLLTSVVLLLHHTTSV